MSAIIFSRIISFGEVYDLFSLGKMPDNPEKYADLRGGISAVFLLPSLCSDVKIEVTDFAAEALFSYIPAAQAAAKFLRSVRGLPLSEITVETPLGVITVMTEKKCCVALDRFSVLYDGKISVLNEELRYITLKSPFGKIRVLKVNSAADFSQSILKETALSQSGEELIGVAAYSEDGNVIYHFSKSGNFPQKLVAAVAVAACIYPIDCSLKIEEDVFDFYACDGKFRLSDRSDNALTFYAPAID